MSKNFIKKSGCRYREGVWISLIGRRVKDIGKVESSLLLLEGRVMR